MIFSRKLPSPDTIKFLIVVDAVITALLTVFLVFSISNGQAAWAAIESSLITLTISDMLRGLAVLRVVESR